MGVEVPPGLKPREVDLLVMGAAAAVLLLVIVWLTHVFVMHDRLEACREALRAKNETAAARLCVSYDEPPPRVVPRQAKQP